MPRVYHVKSARDSKFKRTCATCGEEVLTGESYKYAEPRIGPKLIWCYRHSPKRSQLSASKLGPLWDAIDEFDPASFTDLEALQAGVQEIVSIATDLQGEYEDSLANMPTQEGPVAEQIQENIDLLDAYISELDNAEFTDGDIEENRAEIEIMVARELLDENGVDYEDDQLTDPDSRSELIAEHAALDVYETQVEERIEDTQSGSLEEARSTAQELVGSFEG